MEETENKFEKKEKGKKNLKLTWMNEMRTFSRIVPGKNDNGHPFTVKYHVILDLLHNPGNAFKKGTVPRQKGMARHFCTSVKYR